MNPETRKSHLVSLRDRIASLRVIKCRMAHERVIISPDPARPPVSGGTLPNFKRVGLCSSVERDERLGCSHSMSRVKLDRAISELEPEEAERLGRELNRLTNEIHILDHRKGEAEARLAARYMAGGECGEAIMASELVEETEESRQLERQHDEYVEQVGVLRDRVISEIDKMLGSMSDRRGSASP